MNPAPGKSQPATPRPDGQVKHVRLDSLCVLLLVILCHLPAAAQTNFAIPWYTMDGGSGTSTGGVFQLSATIGQHDAGPTMTNGGFALDGGFWAIISVVQTPDAPLLSLYRTATNTVVVSWPSPSTGFSLQVNTNIASTNWADAGAPADDGTNKFIIVSPVGGNLFYRLKNPLNP